MSRLEKELKTVCNKAHKAWRGGKLTLDEYFRLENACASISIQLSNLKKRGVKIL